MPNFGRTPGPTLPIDLLSTPPLHGANLNMTFSLHFSINVQVCDIQKCNIQFGMCRCLSTLTSRPPLEESHTIQMLL